MEWLLYGQVNVRYRKGTGTRVPHGDSHVPAAASLHA